MQLCLFYSEILDVSQGRYTILDDGTLMIPNAQDDDQGTYECIARNTNGEVKAESVQLRMNRHEHHHQHDHNNADGTDHVIDNQIHHRRETVPFNGNKLHLPISENAFTRLDFSYYFIQMVLNFFLYCKS